MKGVVSSTSGSSNNGGERVVVGRSGSEKEKTKMRERQRRAITTNIFHGLRKHGGYQLSSRADINQVLRELARESGWVVEPDGTTYRSTIPNAFCPLCGAGRRSTTPTPTTSTIAVASGECSATASPQCFTTGDSTLYLAGAGSGVINAPSCQVLKSGHDMPFAIYDVYGRVAGEIHRCSNQRFGPEGAAPAMAVAYQQQQEQYLLEARASNQNTPNGSPSRHV